jgi:hypothetical protein
MQINDLRSYDHPDLSDFVIHFVHRWGKRNDEVPNEILTMPCRDRLFEGILASGQINAYRVFSGFDPVVCFTECTPAGVGTMVRERYEPWGVAFRKDVIFRKGGGPAFYVRGDEWDDVQGLPPRLRARCTKLWPGACPDPGEVIPKALEGESQWTHEREWRIMGTGEPPSFQFQPEDVAFLVLGDWQAASDSSPNVVIDRRGRIEDPNHVWIRAMEGTNLRSASAAR